MEEKKIGNDFFIASEYMDDYFVECDEHLTVIKKDVISLEPDRDPDKKVLEEVFRSCHTIKGLSGMVGITEVEELAHSLEDYFRAIRGGKITISKEGIDLLIEGVKLLEEVLSAKRSGQKPPPAYEFSEKINMLIEGKTQKIDKELNIPEKEDTEVLSKAYDAKQKGMNIWLFRFKPSNDLALRGINVNIVRSRLNDIGDILNAEPNVTEDGGISFSFIVATRKDEHEFQKWREDGLTWEVLQIKETKETEIHELKEHIDSYSYKNTEKLRPKSITNIVRVDLNRLDELMHMVGELVITRARFDDSIKRISSYIPEKEMDFLQETHSSMERQLRNLREAVMRIRMVPIGEVFDRMRFVVMDMSREGKKKVRLEVSGEDTEIDKYVVEMMMDPMLHLVRNAVSHGIEPEEERIAKGKPKEGTISLNAYASGDSVFIEIKDDGRGIDFEKVITRARQEGLIGDGDLHTQDKMINILDIICSSGFSTKEEVDLESGRGIGMAIVKNAIDELGGSLSMETEYGKGTVFIINLPLTLVIVDALILKTGGHTFAIPQPSIREVIEIEMDRITTLENNELIIYRGIPLPILRLSKIFGLTENYGPIVYGLILGSGQKNVGIMVEQVLTKREIVVRPITDPLVSVKGVAGATELGDGKPVLILNASDLINITSMKGGVLNV